MELNERIKSFSEGNIFEFLKKKMIEIQQNQEEKIKKQDEFCSQIDAIKSFMQKDLIHYLGTMQNSLGNYIKESAEKEFENLSQFF